MIKNHRSVHEYTAKRLRRARRLYFFLISKDIPAGVDGVRLIKQLCPRLQERGLYSMNTDRRSIEFSFYRAMYRRAMNLTRDSNSLRRDESWYAWLMSKGYGHSPWYDAAAPEKRRVRA